MSQTEQDRFVDTEMRPIAEKSEQLYYNILSAITSWQKAGLADDGTIYDAERADQGVPGVTGTECYKVKDFLLAVKDAFESDGVEEAIVSLRVRPPHIN